jgi:hypothetical protein
MLSDFGKKILSFFGDQEQSLGDSSYYSFITCQRSYLMKAMMKQHSSFLIKIALVL